MSVEEGVTEELELSLEGLTVVGILELHILSNRAEVLSRHVCSIMLGILR
jgi:hypothetical protein